jgi:hypothetical protein
MPLADRSAARPGTLAPEDQDDAVWIARRMVLDAGTHAARLRRQASAQAASIREAAERETEMIGQQASVRAAAIREAAERQAADLRATVIKLSAGPGEQGGPLAWPGTMRAAEPGARPARRLQGPPRQLAAIRVAAAATAALFLVALATGTTELALHGFAFFVFRAAGTGETSGAGLQENQGPGQPDAPKPTPSHLAQSGTKASQGG